MNTLNCHAVQGVKLGPVHSVFVGDRMVHYRTLYVETATGPVQVTMYAEATNVQINVEETAR